MFTKSAFAALGCTFAVVLGGCGPASRTAPPAVKSSDHAVHDHPTEGPHHGALVELGDEQYHAEVVHNEQAGEVSVYLLDAAATNAVPIDAAELTLNLTHDGQPQQFKLTAAPDAGDPASAGSRFTSADADLLKELAHGHAEGQLVVRIGSKQFRGLLPLAEDDEHHDH